MLLSTLSPSLTQEMANLSDFLLCYGWFTTRVPWGVTVDNFEIPLEKALRLPLVDYDIILMFMLCCALLVNLEAVYFPFCSS